MSSIPIGSCTFRQLYVIACMLNMRIRKSREYVGDSVYVYMYASGPSGDTLKCDNVTLWAIGP